MEKGERKGSEARREAFKDSKKIPRSSPKKEKYLEDIIKEWRQEINEVRK